MAGIILPNQFVNEKILIGGLGIPSSALTLGGQVLTLGGRVLTFGV